MIIFRTNANSNIGFGHLIRCRALAYALKKRGENCIMVGPQKKFMNQNDKSLFLKWISINKWKSSKEDSSFLIKIAQKYFNSYLILDDHRIDEDYQVNLRNNGYKWLQFDNKENSRPMWADIILNPMPGMLKKNFKNIIKNKNAKLLLGPAYAILRPEFAYKKKIKKRKNIKKKILIIFGGGNDRGGIKFVLSALIMVIPKEYSFIVVCGSANPENERIKEWIKENGKKKVDLYINPKNLVSLFMSCSIAVTAGGTTTYELNNFSIPFLIISISRNQIEQSKAWAKYGNAMYLGKIGKVKKKTLINIFRDFLNNKILTNKNKYSQECDGLYQVADCIIEKKLIYEKRNK